MDPIIISGDLVRKVTDGKKGRQGRVNIGNESSKVTGYTENSPFFSFEWNCKFWEKCRDGSVVSKGGIEMYIG